MTEKLRLSHIPEVKHERGQSHPVQATSSDFDDSITSAMFSGLDLLHRGGRGGRKKNRHLDKPTNPSTSSSSSDDDDDDIVSLDSPVQQQQQTLASCIDITFQIPVSQDSTIALSVTSPYRQRSNHISHQSNPYTANLKPPEQAVSVAVNVVPKNPSNDDSDGHDRAATSTANVSWLQFVCVFYLIGYITAC